MVTDAVIAPALKKKRKDDQDGITAPVRTSGARNEDDQSSSIGTAGVGGRRPLHEEEAWAVMVHKLYADRVIGALTGQGGCSKHQNNPWWASSSDSPRRATSGALHGQEDVNPPANNKAFLVDVAPLTGPVRRDRRGYVLLMVVMLKEQSLDAFSQLSPVARQNISWLGRLSHHCQVHLDDEVLQQPAETPSSPVTATTAHSHSAKQKKQNNNNNIVDETRLVMSACLIHTLPVCLGQHQRGVVVSLAEAARLWYQTLTRDYGFDVHQHILRIQVHPTTEPFALLVCRLLQQEQVSSVASDDMRTATALDPDDPYDGPIDFTRSKSRCTHRLNVVLVQHKDDKNRNGAAAVNGDNGSNNSWDCYWAVEEGREQAQLPLNHEASREMEVLPAMCPPNKNNGKKSVKEEQVTATTTTTITSSLCIPIQPVSRAYYKLWQVWQEHLGPYYHHYNKRQALASSSGGRAAALDLGASPGGWTQVLAHQIAAPAQLSHIVAVDAGDLYWTTSSYMSANNRADNTGLPSNKTTQQSQRQQQPSVESSSAPVATKPIEIRHLASRMESADIQSHGPYSLIVCDASIAWMELFPILNESVVTRAEFSLPSVWVLTLKLPHKRANSVRHNVRQLEEKLPTILQDMAAKLWRNNIVIRIRHFILHLMANTDTERTLLVIFEEQPETSEE